MGHSIVSLLMFIQNFAVFEWNHKEIKLPGMCELICCYCADESLLFVVYNYILSLSVISALIE